MCLEFKKTKVIRKKQNPNQNRTQIVMLVCRMPPEERVFHWDGQTVQRINETGGYSALTRTLTPILETKIVLSP